MSKREHAIRGEVAKGVAGGSSLLRFSDSGRSPAATAERSPKFQRTVERAQRLRKGRSETPIDVPVQARSVERLSTLERARYRRSQALLASEGSVLAILRTGNMHLAGLGVYEALLAHSWRIRFSDPEEMLWLLQAAVELAESFDPRDYGIKYVADMQARAWGELANAYRIGDHFQPAARAFSKAFALFQKGSGDPYLKARLLELECSLQGARREFSLALDQLQILSNLYRDLGEPHLAGRSLIIRALYAFNSGRTQDAIQINKTGQELINPKCDPTLSMQAVHNDLLYLVDLGQCSQAKSSLFTNRRNLIYKDRISALKLRGLEGRISYGLGEFPNAEVAFREVKEGLTGAGKSFYRANEAPPQTDEV